ncbi:hypothetical protein GCM10009813_27650 [Brevibacterium marinum]
MAAVFVLASVAWEHVQLTSHVVSSGDVGERDRADESFDRVLRTGEEGRRRIRTRGGREHRGLKLNIP